MIEKLLHTDPDYAWTFLRIIAGLIIFPYGMQKLFPWFGGWGIKKTLKQLTLKKIPAFIAWLVIVGQSFLEAAQNRCWWSVHNLYRCTYRAFARWMGNELVWRKEREGIEYHVMLLSLLLIVIVR